MSDNVSMALLDRVRGSDFAGRIQRVLDSLSMWRLAIINEMNAAAGDERELDLLQAELIENGRAITLLAKSGETLRAGRDGDGTTLLDYVRADHGDTNT